jgi:hypothetical protein
LAKQFTIQKRLDMSLRLISRHPLEGSLEEVLEPVNCLVNGMMARCRNVQLPTGVERSQRMLRLTYSKRNKGLNPGSIF